MILPWFSPNPVTHPAIFDYFIQKGISVSNDYKDATTTMQADVPLPLKSAALPKSEETLHFCPPLYTFERNAYFKPHQSQYTSAISKE